MPNLCLRRTPRYGLVEIPLKFRDVSRLVLGCWDWQLVKKFDNRPTGSWQTDRRTDGPIN